LTATPQYLTPLETDILRMIVGNMSNGEIAFALDVSEAMIEPHIQDIMLKLGVEDRASAAALAIERGLVRIEI
jgi:DNA-binding NarL/FixJ family response regulator